MRPQIGADEGAEGAVSAVQLCGGGEAAVAGHGGAVWCGRCAGVCGVRQAALLRVPGSKVAV
jgi:hypothetical protein